MGSIYCENCRLLLGRNQNLSKDEVETIKYCRCLGKSSKKEKDKKKEALYELKKEFLAINKLKGRKK